MHRLLKLSVQHDAQYKGHTEFKALERSDQQNFARLYEHLLLLIIDEISMVGSLMLAQINDRLREIKTPNKYLPFGNVNVVVFGDLLQLPPVMAPFCFKKLNDADTKTQAKTTYGGYLFNVIINLCVTNRFGTHSIMRTLFLFRMRCKT
jgi:hypothetical protein